MPCLQAQPRAEAEALSSIDAFLIYACILHRYISDLESPRRRWSCIQVSCFLSTSRPPAPLLPMLRVLQAKERFEKRLGAMRADASNTTTNSSATSNTLPPSAPAGSLSRRVPVQAMLTCFYSLHGDFLSEGQLLAPDNIDKIRHIPHPASQCKEPPTSSARPALCLTCRRLGRR